jgi:hypothetical protein
MNTQNVNVKTAAKESTERWVENLLANTISEQKSLLMYLAELKNKRLRESERSELVWGTLMRMADNVLGAGVVDWQADVLRCITALLNHAAARKRWLLLALPVRKRGMTHANTLLTECALNAICHESAENPTSGGGGR